MIAEFHDRIVDSLLHAFSTAETADALWADLSTGLKRHYSAAGVYYGFISPELTGHRRYVCRSTAPEEMAAFSFRLEYYAVDPVRLHAGCSLDPIFYGQEFLDCLTDPPSDYLHAAQLAAGFGWRSVILFPFRGGYDAEITAVAIGFDLSRSEFEALYRKIGLALYAIAGRFHSEYVVRFSTEEREAAPLEDRERTILEQMASGLQQQEIAAQHGVDPRKINDALARLRERFELSSNWALIARVSRLRLLDPAVPEVPGL